MQGYVNFMDELPFWAKIVLALPMLDITWGLYRLFKSIMAKNVAYIVIAAIFIVFGAFPIAIFDIVMLIINKKIWWLID
ncbi:MAG: hypothetical protein ILP02_03950 [Clostridia bacterium]|nr:hypothetical protein [Clostridia bacterium]